MKTRVRSLRRRGRQLPLALQLRGRGGKGRGQGRTKRRFDYVPHVRRPFVELQHPVHVSTRVIPGLPSLRQRHLWEAMRRAIVLTREKGRFRIVHYSVQGQHIHLICEASDRTALARGVQGFKISVGKRVNRRCKRSGRVFRDRYHQRIITNPTQCRYALAYVLGNQRHHAHAERASYPRARVDPCSSAIYFKGWTVEVRPWGEAEVGPPGAEPRSFLLRVGWQRGGGLLSPDHIPGLPRGAPALPAWSEEMLQSPAVA